MKIQCDVCGKDEASVFCTADEAALCDACDHRVHHANKLASKHQRFSLLHPSSKQFPLCDICKERRAFLFCQQDRAILCRECDFPIHKANELTQKHNRFLLTGVKLSSTATLYTSSSSNAVTTNCYDSVPDYKSQPRIKNSVPSSDLTNSQQTLLAKSSVSTPTTLVTDREGDDQNLPANQTSSISEYLIETLPGWHVEDFLDSIPTPFGFCKSDDSVLPFLDADLKSNMDTFSPEINFGVWVPQQPADILYPKQIAGQNHVFKERKESTSINFNRSCMEDGFTVPQINLPSTGSKRSRPFW